VAAGRIVVAGASGFIGRALVGELTSGGYAVTGLTRGPGGAGWPAGALAVTWDARPGGDWAAHVDGAFAVVNLTGDNLAKGRWTRAKRERILASRTGPGAALAAAVRSAAVKPRVFVQASAVGYYGDTGETAADESSPAGEGFLAGVVRAWEEASSGVEAHGVRRIVVRSGLVLGRDGGVWPSLVRPFRFFVGGPLGSGRQWFSWISLADEVRAVRFLIEREGLAGPFNLTAPGPLRQRELCRIIGAALRRPCWAPVPAPVLKALFGSKAKETLLVSQRVLPRRLAEAGFEFRHPDAAAAVDGLVRRGLPAGCPAG
jgi:uncharacterized protein (TIGR01777 family)